MLQLIKKFADDNKLECFLMPKICNLLILCVRPSAKHVFTLKRDIFLNKHNDPAYFEARSW
jgi:hypothetical protein